MKKVLSVILAVVMLVGCLPFTVFADNTVTFTTSGQFTSSDQLLSGTTYVITNGATMTVPSDLNLNISAGVTLKVDEGATLDVLGSVTIYGFGTLTAYGKISHSDHIFINKDTNGEEDPNAVAKVQFRFPDLNDDAIKLADKITVSIDFDGIDESDKNVPATGKTILVPLNKEIRVNAHIIEPRVDRDKFDDSLLKLKLNDVGFTYEKGKEAGTGYYSTTATTGGDISYAKWTQDVDFLTTKRIVLPSGEGYEVLPRYPDKVKRTEDGTIVVKYGEPFSFYVDVDEAYDMSSYEVYIYNGYGWLNLDLTADPENPENLSFTDIAAKPDDNGYYNVPAVTGDLTISVRGILKNSTINLIGNLLETFKNIFNMIKEFFEGLKDLFGIKTAEE